MKNVSTPGARIATRSEVSRRQAPLRATYERSPASALIVKRVTTFTDTNADALHGSVAFPYDGACLRYGVDRAVGGLHDAPNPGEMLCAALAACADASIRMVADLLGIALRRLEVEAVAEVDVRGCLGIDRNVPVGFTSMACRVRIGAEPGTNAEALAILLARAESACINLATLRSGVAIEVSHEIDAS